MACSRLLSTVVSSAAFGKIDCCGSVSENEVIRKIKHIVIDTQVIDRMLLLPIHPID